MSDLIVNRSELDECANCSCPWPAEPHDARVIRLGGREFVVLGVPSPAGVVTYQERDSGRVETLFFARLKWVFGTDILFDVWATPLLDERASSFVWVESENTHGMIGAFDWAVVGPLTFSGVFRAAVAWKW